MAAKDEIINLDLVKKVSKEAHSCFYDYVKTVSIEENFPFKYLPRYDEYGLNFLLSISDGNPETVSNYCTQIFEKNYESHYLIDLYSESIATMYLSNGNLDLFANYNLNIVKRLKDDPEIYDISNIYSEEELKNFSEEELEKIRRIDREILQMNIDFFCKQIENKERLYEIITKSKDEFSKCPDFLQHKDSLENFITHQIVISHNYFMGIRDKCYKINKNMN